MPSKLLKVGLKRLNCPFHGCRKREIASFGKTYSPDIESTIYDKWEKGDYFLTERGGKSERFSMILPPPNVTGTLHLGHALTVTLQDTIARQERMLGKEVVWVPGTDHAGIATQVIVERELHHKLNKSRHDLGRDKFVSHVWNWKNAKGDQISKQLKKLGASLDWSKEFFTLDTTQNASVVQALIKLWDLGLIYRGETLVNWSCTLRSAISDIEVDHIPVNGPTNLSVPGFERPVIFGQLVKFAYQLANSDDEIIVATTRVETMLGDVAVAVHPNDARYKQYIGKTLIHPFSGKILPIISDEHVDQEFGTGAVKITPAHDQTDFEIGKTHSLPFKTVINDKGFMTDDCGQFSGMYRFEVREEIMRALSDKGLLRSVNPHKMQVPICSRSGDVIELIIKPQWFLKCGNMAERVIDAVKNKELIIEPERYHKDWFSWLEGIKDWCISRQLWWGHQIPFYFCEDSAKGLWVAALSEKDALIKAKKSLSGNITVKRDPDVLDTWFSSGLLPFSSLGWLENNQDFKYFYPLSSMVTGHDILFFWVARMAMLGLQLTDKLPFKRILLHSIICDSQGRKMSKSLGNVIDPIDVIEGCSQEKLKNQVAENYAKGLLNTEEYSRTNDYINKSFPQGIPSCGTDALRFTLLSQNIKNLYINFNVQDCYGNKLFCNKIWQATKFTCGWAEKIGFHKTTVDELPTANNEMDQWILGQLSTMLDTIHSSYENNNFHLITSSLRTFLYSDFCDVYIESVKPLLKTESAHGICHVLTFCLDRSLRCLAPIMPFVTETLYRQLPQKEGISIMKTSYPDRLGLQNELIKHKIDLVKEIILNFRRMKTENGLNLQKVKVGIITHGHDISTLLYVIETLAKCDVVMLKEPPLSLKSVHEKINKNTDIYLLLDQVSSQQKIQKVSHKEVTLKQRKKLESSLKKMLDMTSNVSYKEKVADNVKEAHILKINKLRKELDSFRDFETDRNC